MEATLDSVVVYKKFDEGKATFDGSWNAESIVTFVLGEQLPLVTKFTDEVWGRVFVSVLYFHFYFPSDCSQDIWRADEDSLASLFPR